MPDRNYHFFINTALFQLIIQCTCVNVVRCAKEKSRVCYIVKFCLNGNVNQVDDLHCAGINLSKILFQLKLVFQSIKDI